MIYGDEGQLVGKFRIRVPNKILLMMTRIIMYINTLYENTSHPTSAECTINNVMLIIKFTAHLLPVTWDLMLMMAWPSVLLNIHRSVGRLGCTWNTDSSDLRIVCRDLDVGCG